MTPANPIEHSFELAAERCEDMTPVVYRRLFREHPETRAMFRSQGSDLVKGSMLALTIEAILDFAGERRGHFRLIECEVASHDAYGTPRELFVEFFGVIGARCARSSEATGRPRSTRRGEDLLTRTRSGRHRNRGLTIAVALRSPRSPEALLPDEADPQRAVRVARMPRL